MCRTHMYKEVHTAGDLSDLVQQGISSYTQTLQIKGKGKDSSRVAETSIKTICTTKSATEQRTLLQHLT